MKKIIIILLVLLSAQSCQEEFLDRYPTTSLVVENFYKTPADAEQALTAAYAMLKYDDWWSVIIFSEIKSDDCAGGAGTGDGGGFQQIDRAIPWTSTNSNQEAWNYYYGGIFRANSYLENERLIDWTGNEKLQLQYQAEARFLRGYMHFYLARMFGTIPYLNHTISPGEVYPRTPAEELYSGIIDDFKFCAEYGLSTPYPGNISSWGRATKWAAKAMIARVYLFYSGYYNDNEINGLTAQQAQTYLDNLIDSSGHALVPKYASLWLVPTYSELGSDTSLDEYAGEENSEVLWSVRYDQVGNFAMPFLRMIGPRGTNIDPYGQGWGAMSVLPSLWDEYDSTDTRRTATILSWEREGITYDYVTNQQAQYTGYNTKKYDIPSQGGTISVSDFQLGGYEDYQVIRFADVLLMAAELHLLNGDAGTALTYVNMVRERAFGSDSKNYTSITIDDIYKERKLELACEGIRYWDILRQCKGDFSKLAEVLTYIDDTDGGDFSQSADVYSLDVDGNNYVITKGLFQLPTAELDLMEGIIEQNPGY